MSRKSERLVNLTIALLATSRWLTKSDIFKAIDGYSGDVQAQERMFERDKEELRNLGIEIEVGTFDPLFEDEVGYRIRPEKYQINIKELSSVQLSLLSAAALSWRSAEVKSQASSVLLKLNALGISCDADSLNIFAPVIFSSDENLERVLDAIAARKMISFQYRNSDFSLQERVIEPYGVGTKNGYWYVAGRDLDRKSIRLFRLDRCVALIKEQGKAGSYEVPGDFLMVNHLSARDRNRSCTLSVRVNRGNEIRKFSALIESSEDWDTLLYSYTEDSELMSDLLWHGDDVKVIAPVEIVAQYNSILADIAKLHG